MTNLAVLYDAPGPKTRVRHRIYAVASAVAVLGIGAWIVWRLYDNNQFEYDKWEVFITPRYVEVILVDGLLKTLQMAGLAVLGAIVMGFVLGVGKLSDHRSVRWPAWLVVELFRALPVLLLMIFIWYTIGIQKENSGYWAVIAALTLYNGAVLAEVLRAGVLAVPKGQSEAAYAIGMRKSQVLNIVLLPQAVKIMLPAMISQCVVVVKDTALGLAVDVFDEDGNALPSGKGELVCKGPFPSMPVGFWNDPRGEKYRAAYFSRFPNVWHHGDFAEWTGHGGMIIHGRSDATLNPGGVRIGTAEIYAQVETVPEVLEALAIGQDWDNDVRIVLFVRLKEGAALDDALIARIKSVIRSGASPRHVPAKIVAVADIPRTKSNKIVELAVREIVHGRPVKNSEALANPEALELFRDLAELRT